MEWRVIKSTNGYDIIVDVDDFLWLMKYDWYVFKDHRNYYARRKVKRLNGKHTLRCIHQEIMLYHYGPANGLEVDHKNHDGLDNRKENIWYCTRLQNAQNRRYHGRNRSNASSYPGATFHKLAKKWQAQVIVNGKNTYLGLFATPEEAYQARVKFLETLGERAK